MQRTAKADFASEFIDLPKAAQVADAEWEPFQIEYLNNEDRLSADVKSRQIAWSFTAALDAVCDAIVHPGTPHVFVSINLDEAREKIRYANSIINAIDAPARPKLLRASLTEIELSNQSRLTSHPCKPVRGRAQARVYLDEIAHYKDGLDRDIYLAALPATTRGGYLRMGSSPLGAKGLFWEIVTENLRKWPGFKRQFIPWWQIRSLCKDIKTTADQLTTEERVRAFGTDALIEIFENMFLEDFQQEYECAWVDELTAWISWEIIKRNQDNKLVWWHARNVDDAISMADEVAEASRLRKIEQVFVGGIDVGRKRNLTEMIILGKSTTDQLPIRFQVSLDRIEFDDQEKAFEHVINVLPFTQVYIDQNGIGMQLAESLERTGRAEGVTFTNASKELWAVGARIAAERKQTPLPVDRDIAYQLHCIKKKVTVAKNNVFDTDRNEKHHADIFWAWALAIDAANGGRISSDDLAGLGSIEDFESPWR